MTINIIRLFPQSVYIEDNVRMDLLKDLEESVKSKSKDTKRSAVLNTDSSHLVDRKLHLNEPFSHLSQEIIKHCKEYMRAYGYSEYAIKSLLMLDMWFNISGKGDFNFPHIHPGSFLSGAYYVKSIPENHLIFSEDKKNIYEEPERFNELSAPFFPVPCIPGRLVIFHGDMRHGTPAQQNEGEKIVISFNTILRK